MTVEVPDGSPIDPEGWLGVDLGIRNLAVDSDGEAHSGEATSHIRSRIARSPRGAPVALGQRAPNVISARSEGGSAASTPTRITSSVSRSCARPETPGAVSPLRISSGIRDRVTVRKAQRATLHSWSFFRVARISRLQGHALGRRSCRRGPAQHESNVPRVRQHRQGEPPARKRSSSAPDAVLQPRRPRRRSQHRIQGRSNPAYRSAVRLGIEHVLVESSAMPGPKLRPLGRG